MQSISTTSQYWLQTRADSHGYIGVDQYRNLTLKGTTSDALRFGFSVAPDATKWNICTTSRSSRYCLDQNGLNATQVLLGDPGYFSGQQWTVKSNAVSGQSTYWTLQSDFAGPNKYLAITNVAGPDVYMLTDPVYMYWLLVEIDSTGKAVSGTTSSVVTSTTSSTIQINTAGASPTVNSNTTPTSSTQASLDNGSDSSTLSVGPIVGIALGSVVIIVIAVLAGMFLHRRRKSRKLQHAPPTSAPRWQMEESKYVEPPRPQKIQPTIVEAPTYSYSWEAPNGVDRHRHELEGSWRGPELGTGRTL